MPIGEALTPEIADAAREALHKQLDLAAGCWSLASEAQTAAEPQPPCKLRDAWAGASQRLA